MLDLMCALFPSNGLPSAIRKKLRFTVTLLKRSAMIDMNEKTQESHDCKRQLRLQKRRLTHSKRMQTSGDNLRVKKAQKRASDRGPIQ